MWIPFCEFVVRNYANFGLDIEDDEVRCLEKCDIYPEENIVKGGCYYTKYSRKRTKTLQHTQHEFADGLHYHYRCVLNELPESFGQKLINAKDKAGLKTHYPYYSGLETLVGC